MEPACQCRSQYGQQKAPERFPSALAQRAGGIQPGLVQRQHGGAQTQEQVRVGEQRDCDQGSRIAVERGQALNPQGFQPLLEQAARTVHGNQDEGADVAGHHQGCRHQYRPQPTTRQVAEDHEPSQRQGQQPHTGIDADHQHQASTQNATCRGRPQLTPDRGFDSRGPEQQVAQRQEQQAGREH